MVRRSLTLRRSRIFHRDRRGMAPLEVVMTAGLTLPTLFLLVFAAVRVCRIVLAVIGSMIGSPYM